MQTFNHGRSGLPAILQSKYKGNCEYYVRGVIQGIQVDDILNYNGIRTVVKEIISASDSKANLPIEEAKNAHVEFIVYDTKFNATNYFPAQNFGN